MKNSLVMTVLGADRPGIVDLLAHTIASHDGNWVESRMAHLAGQFAGILRVEIAADRSAGLAAALAHLQDSSGLALQIRPEPAHDDAESQTVAATLELVGQDRPGIVREITHVLALEGVNVEELTTQCVSAANSGQPLFQAAATLGIPPEKSPAQIAAAIERIATDLMVDVKFATSATT